MIKFISYSRLGRRDNTVKWHNQKLKRKEISIDGLWQIPVSVLALRFQKSSAKKIKNKKIKCTTSSCTKGFRGRREQSVKQRPECKLSGECNQRRGSEGGRNWCRKKKEIRQSCVWRWPCLQSSACTVQGDQRVTVWKVSQQQPKGGSGVSAALHCHPITGQRFFPWTSAVTHVCAKHITMWPHPQHYSEAWRQKARPYQVDLRSAWSAAPVGTSWHPTELDTAGIRDKWGPNLGNGSQHLWHTHTHWWEGTILLSPFCNFISIFLDFSWIYVSN